MKLIDGRTALFVDGMHLYAISRNLGFEVDYRSLLALFNSQTKLARANYYSTVLEDSDYSPLKPLIDWLSYNNWVVNSKPGKEFVDATGKRRVRGSMVVEIAADMFEASSWTEHAILIAGDADLRRAVELIQRRGVRVTLISAVRNVTPMIDDALRRQADEFIDISDIAPEFTRPSEKRAAAGKIIID